MTIRFLRCLILFLGFISCDQNKDSDLPVCIEAKIEGLKTLPKQNPPALVAEWKVGDKTYYYFTSDCCDQFNYLYDEDCNVICAPDGGITGEGDGTCPDLTGKIERILWEDPR